MGTHVQDEIKILENLKATLGVKFEHNTFTGGDYTPRASLVYAPWKEHAFRWSVARAFRPPTFFEDAFNMSHPSSYWSLAAPRWVGNKRLDNETLRSVEFGYTGRFIEKLDVNIETFYYDYGNLILPTFVNVPPLGPHVTFKNNDRATSKGVEVDLKYPITKWWEAEVNYSFADFDDKKDILQHFYPVHLANVVNTFRLPENVSARLWVNYFDDIRAITPGNTPADDLKGYVRLDARLAKGFAKGKGEVSLTVQNLLGDHDEGGTFVRNPRPPFTVELVGVDRKVFFALDLHF